MYVLYGRQGIELMISFLNTIQVPLWEEWAKPCCPVSASLKTFIHHLFLQPSAAVAWPALHHSTVPFRHTGRSIKTIFQMFVMFVTNPQPSLNVNTPEDSRHRTNNPVPMLNCVYVQIILIQAHSDVCVMPAPSCVTFKGTWRTWGSVFNKMSPMHYLDEILLVTIYQNQIDVSWCADVW